MANHPINGLMETAMQSIKDMVDVNTIIETRYKHQMDLLSFQYPRCHSAWQQAVVNTMGILIFQNLQKEILHWMTN